MQGSRQHFERLLGRGYAPAEGKRWYAMSKGEARSPDGAPVLLRVEVDIWARPLKVKPSVRFVTASVEGASQVRELQRNDDGLFDVT